MDFINKSIDEIEAELFPAVSMMHISSGLLLSQESRSFLPCSSFQKLVLICLSLNSTGTYFAIKYQRLSKKRGKKKAIIAIARMMLTSIYHML